MVTGSDRGWKVFALAAIVAMTTGCEGEVVLMGNTASMVITCAMLWGTLKINRAGVRRDSDDTASK
jgi:hypothetical protein